MAAGCGADAEDAWLAHEDTAIGSRYSNQVASFVTAVKAAQVFFREDLKVNGAAIEFEPHSVVLVVDDLDLCIACDAQVVAGLEQQFGVSVGSGFDEVALFEFEAGFERKLRIVALVNHVACYRIRADPVHEPFEGFALLRRNRSETQQNNSDHNDKGIGPHTVQL